MNTRRSYDMHSRGVAAEATRERLLGCGQELFLSRWYDEVTIAVVAREAGVSSQTLLNHFGSKENLFAEVVKRLAAELNERRDRAESADIAGAVAILVDDYEITGDATIRLLAIEERIPALG
jgi:AcrR family transcriptional regulator